MNETITVTTTQRVTTVTINRPEKRNAITQEMYGAMASAIADYVADDGVRALVITGAGDYFTAGNDLKDFSMADRGKEEPPVTKFLRAISTCPKPLIAAVNGPAIGVGLTMLLHCDLVYAGAGATFNAPFVKLALVPEAASSLLLAQSVGMAVANDILMAGRVLTAAEAERHGLVSRVFADAELSGAVSGIAQGVASAAPTAMRQTKALIRHQRDQVAAQMGKEAEVFVAQLKTPDFAEAVAAFMQKRPAVFS